MQIDNWNDQRLQDDQEQLLIKNLSDEFQANHAQLKTDIELVTGVKNGLLELLNVISKRPENFSEDDMDELLFKSFSSPGWDPSSYVLSDLKNSGRISTIRNQKLKLLLFEWERLFGETIKSRESYQIYAREYYAYITKHGSVRNVDALFERRELAKSILDVSNLALLDDPKFENAVSNFFALTDSLLTRYELADTLIIDITIAAKE